MVKYQYNQCSVNIPNDTWSTRISTLSHIHLLYTWCEHWMRDQFAEKEMEDGVRNVFFLSLRWQNLFTSTANWYISATTSGLGSSCHKQRNKQNKLLPVFQSVINIFYKPDFCDLIHFAVSRFLVASVHLCQRMYRLQLWWRPHRQIEKPPKIQKRKTRSDYKNLREKTVHRLNYNKQSVL